MTSDYDPADCRATRAFRQIQEQTHCTFASRAKVWGAPPYPDGSTLASYLESVPEPFTRFLALAEQERLHGFVIELPDARFGSSIAQLSETVRRILGFLSERNPGQSPSLEVHQPGWNFMFQGSRCFVSSIAPCYGPDSSRYGFGATSTFVFLQLHSSFAHFRVPSGEHRNVRLLIRAAYARNGRAYDGNAPCEAEKFVKPLALGDPPVRWWQSDSASRT